MSAYSVLMSVYIKEEAPYFRTAVESMLNQTVPPEQFVLVCDGPLTKPLNDVVAWCEKTAPELFTVVRLPENRGLGLALQEGLQVCRNELVARMDADDIAIPDRMEKTVEEFSVF
jgi:glycosyltransferase involved in cell wall biosynthesis